MEQSIRMIMNFLTILQAVLVGYLVISLGKITLILPPEGIVLATKAYARKFET
jgi:hypothetical protein